jgi:enoyl-CoA hydratase/carnithine racemase
VTLLGDEVLYSVADGVATLTLNNPQRRNAWSPAMGRAYRAQLERAIRDLSVRAIVVTGAGGNFCPGPDAAALADAMGGADAGHGSSDEMTDDPVRVARAVSKPMIAAVEGLCAGIGLLQALLCDLRFVAEGARLSTAYARRGLPAEHGMSWLLPRLVGVEAALDLLLSGRTLDAAEAVELRLATRRTEHGGALRAARAYATELATYSSPSSMASIRDQVWADMDRDLGEALAAAQYVTAEFNADNSDFAEGVQSFRERRPPNFAPLNPDGPLSRWQQRG